MTCLILSAENIGSSSVFPRGTANWIPFVDIPYFVITCVSVILLALTFILLCPSLSFTEAGIVFLGLSYYLAPKILREVFVE